MVNTSRFLVLCLVGFLYGCNSGISDKNLTFITPSESVTLMQDGKSNLLGIKTVKFVDSRQVWDFDKSHIKGSTNIPFGWLRLLSGELDDVTTIIVYGETYNDYVSIAMSKELISLGFTDVRTLRGGFRGWCDADEPIETPE
ncbi:MAG: rhodanese-like domain-containing protein [Planctomycetes bacterium]|nr:rhodanese-like domain-containing protein [Planctomycetota bacterium]